ncbi:phosphotransferase enzyme family protein [Tengunoibacter tsumagoiensis]|uniref:Aminoglycoside phosphotransferase n=1 Tax=Tengunoibacter tsumagoiensis TaxID=2014871 RepID=A0A402AB12_9CHLR|nr:phosphotransferase [Tengunoibacter tsumagoiensis]GCE16145.1 aminoglycoside phosphotransferase [Tengunoibacter tsumagoiensis]
MDTQEQVNYTSQLRQMRILAEAALTHYDLGTVRLSLLAHRGNTIFRVTAMNRQRVFEEGEESVLPESGRFVLRLCDPSSLEMPMLQSELIWLAALRREAELVVPEPVFTRTGELVFKVMVEDVSEVRYAMLFRWVEGRFVDGGLSPSLLERVGTFMARLHQHARYFTPPAGFIRPRWEWEQTFGRAIFFEPSLIDSPHQKLITPKVQHLLHTTCEWLREELQSLPRDPDNYGLIHFDLQQENYLFHQGEVRAIDFNDCCWNYYLFDIAITLGGIAGRPDEQAMRKTFFKGYKRIRALPAHYEERLHIFTAITIMKRMHYLWTSSTPTTQAAFPAYLQFASEHLPQLMNPKVRST